MSVGPDGDAEVGNLPTGPYFGDVAFLPDGRRVMAADADGRVVLWDPATGSRVNPVGPRIDNEHAFDLTADGRTIAFAYAPTITAWDVASGVQLFDHHFGHDSMINRVDWTPDGRWLAAPDERQGGVAILDRWGSVVSILPAYGTVARFGADGDLLAVAAYSEVSVWDWRREELIRSFPASGWALAFDPAGSRLVTNGEEDGAPELWDVESGRRIAFLLGHTGEAMEVAFSPDGKIVATAGSDRTVRLFDAETGAPLLVLRGHVGAIRGLAFSPDGSELVSHGPGAIRVWALDIERLLEIARENVTRPMSEEECLLYLHRSTCPDAVGASATVG